MQICLLSDGYPPWDRGGAQKIAAQVGEGYAARGHDVDVITTVTDRADTGRTTESGVTVHRRHTPRPRALLPYLTVYNPFVADACERLLASLDPDVVHAHNVHWLSNAALRAAARHAPVVKTFHDSGTFAYGEFTDLVAETPVDGPIQPDAYRASPWRQAREQGPRFFPARNWHNRTTIDQCIDVGVAVSDALRRGLQANGVACTRMIHNGVDVSPWSEADGGQDSTTTRGQSCTGGHEAEAGLRQEYGLGTSPFVLFGGRTGPSKGCRELAAAFRRVCGRLDEDPALVITGDSASVDEMRSVAEPYGDQLAATGWVSRARLRTALGAARVVATPSVHLDPFPTVNLEAFAAGTPVVTTRFGGADELVDDGTDGRIVDPRDIDGLASALEMFLTDPKCASRYGAAGQRKVRRQFTVDQQVAEYLDLLETLL